MKLAAAGARRLSAGRLKVRFPVMRSFSLRFDSWGRGVRCGGVRTGDRSMRHRYLREKGMGSKDDASRCGAGRGVFRVSLGVRWLGCSQAVFMEYRRGPQDALGVHWCP